MKAIVVHEYGGPEGLKVEDYPDPVPDPGEVLVRVATSVNPIDYKRRAGQTKDFYPMQFPGLIGIDIAGTVVKVGQGVEGFSIGDHVFRNSVTEADVLPVTLRTAAKVAKIKKVAVLYGNDDVFTKSGYDNFKKALDDQKMPVTTTETFAKGDVDFKAQLTKIKATNPDAIVLSALIAEGAPIMVQARQLGLNVPFIGGNGMNSVKVFDLAKGASDGLWVGSPWSIENRTPQNTSFIIAYTKQFSSPPDQFAAQAYDAMHIAAEALKKVKLSGDVTKDREALQAALPAIKWTGATGAFSLMRASTRPDHADDIASSPVERSCGGCAPAVHHTFTLGFNSRILSIACFTLSSVTG